MPVLLAHLTVQGNKLTFPCTTEVLKSRGSGYSAGMDGIVQI
jgi:hypothetical protein